MKDRRHQKKQYSLFKKYCETSYFSCATNHASCRCPVFLGTIL